MPLLRFSFLSLLSAFATMANFAICRNEMPISVCAYQPTLPFPIPPPQVDVCDWFNWLAKVRTSSVDLVITDPPYSTLEKHRAWGTTTRLKRAWFPTISDSAFAPLFSEIYRVLKKNTHFYIFCDSTTMFHAKPLAEQAGFTFWRPLVWCKGRLGMGYHYRGACEYILFFEKGKRRLNSRSVPDVLQHKSVRGKYPTQKPVSLLEVLVQQSSDRGDLVVDPFMGSGSTAVAAARHERAFSGCDISLEAATLAAKRLEFPWGPQP